MANYFEELRRRNVFRVAAAYAVVAWLLVEVLSTVLPMFSVPEWVLRLIVILIVVGFVPAVIFAWAFEITPDGIKRESQVDRSQSISHDTAKKLDVIVIILLVVAVGLFVVERFVMTPQMAQPTSTVVSSDRIDSIAVLPFEDFSPGGDHAYVGTGIADTILHSLAQIEGLRVAARTSSFQLHQQNTDIASIGRLLGVGAVLEGSVQASGNRLRIIAQLIRTSDQSHIWSQTFDATADDLFATQDMIAAAVTSNLRGGDAPRPVAQERTTPEVFELVARGRDLWYQRNAADTTAAVAALQRAVTLDPEYAQAWSELAAAHWFAHLYGSVPREEARSAALAAADRALILDDTLAQPWAVRGLITGWDGNLPDAIEHLQQAISLNPNYADAYAWLGGDMIQAGLHNEGRAMFERAFALDPMAAYVRGAYAGSLISDGSAASRRRAREIVAESRRLLPDEFRTIVDAAGVEMQIGDLTTAVDHLADALRQRSSPTLQSFLVNMLLLLGEEEAAGRWGAVYDSQVPESLAGSWRYAIGDWQGLIDSYRRALAEQPDNALAKSNLAWALMLDGQNDEALSVSEEALALFEAGRYRNMPSTMEVSTMTQLVWLHRNVGDAARAAELQAQLGPRLAALERNGLGADINSTMMQVDYEIIAGDQDRAIRLLREMGVTNFRYFMFIWERLPWWQEFRERGEVRAIVAEWRAQQAAERARVRATAPAFIYEPALLETATQ